eukprot:3532138-Pleurochrysis_carterae.AAC.1
MRAAGGAGDALARVCVRARARYVRAEKGGLIAEDGLGKRRASSGIAALRVFLAVEDQTSCSVYCPFVLLAR